MKKTKNEKYISRHHPYQNQVTAPLRVFPFNMADIVEVKKFLTNHAHLELIEDNQSRNKVIITAKRQDLYVHLNCLLHARH